MSWLRRFFRKRMNPIDPEIAIKKKYQLSLMYSFFAWNSFAFLVYYLIREKFPKTNNSIEYAKLLGIKDATVISYKGITKINEKQIKLKDSDLYGYEETNETNQENVVV